MTPDEPVGETPEVASGPLMSSEDVGKWRERIKKSEAKRQKWEKWWDAVIEAYSPDVDDDPKGYFDDIRTNRLFSKITRKQPDLFFQVADVSIAPSPLLDAIPSGADVASAHESIINEKLGLDGVRARRKMSRAVFDLLMFGLGWMVVGYRQWTQDVTENRPVMGPDGQPVMQVVPDPATGVPMPQPLMAPQTVPVPIKSECYMDNISPRQLLKPASFKSTDFDEAPWLGYRFEMPLTHARRMPKWNIPTDFKPSDADVSEARFTIKGEAAERSEENVTGVFISLKTSVFDDKVMHPDHLSELVFIDGVPDAVCYRPSPHQTFDQRGRLTPDSLVGHPICCIDTRMMTDESDVMSDAAMLVPQVNELDKFRRQGIIMRDINILRYLVSDEVPEKVLDNIQYSGIGGLIRIPKDVIAQFDQHFRQFQTANIPPDNWATASALDNDISQTISIDANAAGVVNAGGTTATEANIVQGNRNVTIGFEQNCVAEAYIGIVTKFSTLVQRYLTPEDAAVIVGMEKAMAWKQWATSLPTRLSFRILPDSQLRNDTPMDRKQDMDLYQFFANEPRINRGPLVASILEKWHKDVRKIVIPDEKMSKPGPDAGKLLSPIKGEDFSPLSPQFPIMVELFQAVTGIPISQQALQNAMAMARMAEAKKAAEEAQQQADRQPPHGGAARQAEPLSKHQADMTGGMQGTGALLPGLGGPAGGVQ